MFTYYTATMFTFGLDTLEDIVTDQLAVELSGIYHQIYHMPENIEILYCYNVYIWVRHTRRYCYIPVGCGTFRYIPPDISHA